MKKFFTFLLLFLISDLSISTAYAEGPRYSDEVFDGCYTFVSALSDEKCLDVSGASRANGANIQLWEDNNSIAQKFYITREYDNWYSIRNLGSYKALDVVGGVSGNGVNVQQYDWNGTYAQLWRFIDAGNGYYYIQNRLGYVLDVDGYQTSNGVNIQVWESHGGNNQRWRLKPCESRGFLTLTSELSGSMRLDVSGAGTSNGTNIQLWSSNNSYAQIFCIERVDPDWICIRSAVSGKVLDVAGGVSASGVNVQLYAWNGSDAQRWKLYNAGNGYCYIYNKLGYYLDVCGGNISEGTNVWVYQLNYTGSQKWRIEEADLRPMIMGYIFNSQMKDGIMNLSQPLPKLVYYYQNFNHGAKYDIKRKSCWNNMFTNKSILMDIPYPGFDDTILFNGERVTPEALGNIIYGFTGNYLHLGDRIIFQGGGLAAGGNMNDAPLYGDSCKDHEYIEKGIKLCGNTQTLDLDLSEFPSWLINMAKTIL